MLECTQFHDGYFEGFLIEGASIRLFLATEDGARYTVVASNVVAFNASGFREGNIILGVTVRNCSEIELADMVDLCDLGTDSGASQQQELRLAEVRRRELNLLDLSSSYGGDRLVLAGLFTMNAR